MIIVHVKLPTSENNAHAVKKQRLTDEIHDDRRNTLEHVQKRDSPRQAEDDKVASRPSAAIARATAEKFRSVAPLSGSRCKMAKFVPPAASNSPVASSEVTSLFRTELFPRPAASPDSAWTERRAADRPRTFDRGGWKKFAELTHASFWYLHLSACALINTR